MKRPLKARLGLAVLAALFSVTAEAQRPLAPNPDSLSIAASPAMVTFTLKPTGLSNGSAPVSVTTTWQMQRGGTQVTLYAYFSNAAAALSSGGGGVIPSSKVFGKVGANPFSAFTGPGPFSAGGSLLIFTERVRGNKQATRTVTLGLQIDTTGLHLAPGTYTGVLLLQAQAI